MLLTFIRAVVTITLVLFLTPQTSLTYYNYVLEAIHSTGIFLSYPDAKRFVERFTWGSVFLYILLNIYLH